MALAFTLGALSYWLLALFGTNAWTFVLCAALIFLTWGEIFSLFPSTCTDLFGPRFATANSMMLYTAKGTSALLVPLANVLKTATGSWQAVFLVAAGMNLLVVVLALCALLPIRHRHHRMVAAAG
jgi:OFA family oxalate/formate antiporter-like MFS transporter